MVVVSASMLQEQNKFSLSLKSCPSFCLRGWLNSTLSFANLSLLSFLSLSFESGMPPSINYAPKKSFCSSQFCNFSFAEVSRWLRKLIVASRRLNTRLIHLLWWRYSSPGFDSVYYYLFDLIYSIYYLLLAPRGTALIH